jgi:hypothetical protein
MTEDILLRIVIALLLVITGLCWHIGDLQTERGQLRNEVEHWRQVYIKFINR